MSASATRDQHAAVRQRDPTQLDVPITSKSEIVEFVSDYDLPTAVPCAIVACHQPHKRGKIVYLQTGDYSRIGNVCGKRLLGDVAFTHMQKDLDERERRALHERYITSSAFNPMAALRALDPWTDRAATISKFKSDWSRLNNDLLRTLITAAEHGENRFSVSSQDGTWQTEQLQGMRFLSIHWEELFSNTKHDILCIHKILQKETLNDIDLRDAVRLASECQRRLRIIADIMDSFNVFCGPANVPILRKYLRKEVEIPQPILPLDRSAIDLLGTGTT